MENRDTDSDGYSGRRATYDRDTIKVVICACLIIAMAVAFTGISSYFITRGVIINKLRTRDLFYIIDTVSSRIDGRIAKARETSMILASDPMLTDWIGGGGQDGTLRSYAQQKLDKITAIDDYSNAFIASSVSGYYWSEGAQRNRYMKIDMPDADWFSLALKSRKEVQVNIDYDHLRQNAFVFVSALIGGVKQPMAVAGVGFSLYDLEDEFKEYKPSERSNVWLINEKGSIYISDEKTDEGKLIEEFIPAAVAAQVNGDVDCLATQPKLIEYQNEKGETIDLVYQMVHSVDDAKLVVQIPQAESIVALERIKVYTLIAAVITLLLLIFVFYFISQRIADPLKRALLFAAEMKKQVNSRTQELAQKNQEIMDSIEYAEKLQKAILVTDAEMRQIFADYFVFWQPRDIVGGDLYWVRKRDDGMCFVALIDCTGHGIPGAFMTMAVNATLNHLVDLGYTDPGEMIAELNRQVKRNLHRGNSCRISDDGLDIGLCRIKAGCDLVFAGAKISLYVARKNKVTVIKGDRQSIGYQSSSDDLTFNNQIWTPQPGDGFYLTTDGYIDQNGGAKNYALGRKRFIGAIAAQGENAMHVQKEEFIALLKSYMGDEAQRDDITMIGFSLGS